MMRFVTASFIMMVHSLPFSNGIGTGEVHTSSVVSVTPDHTA